MLLGKTLSLLEENSQEDWHGSSGGGEGKKGGP